MEFLKDRSWVLPATILIYINDILLSFILFADDTNLLMSRKNLDILINKINEELEKVSIWLK